MNLSEIQLRPAQREILDYDHGFMGISAVPGSGKTYTLSLLAAKIVASGKLIGEQEVLVVTLVNSAVDNFYRRVNQFVQAQGLLPFTGYRVRTLHGLSNDIVRERPGLVQLDDQFQIIDEHDSNSIRAEAVRAWLRNHTGELDEFINLEIEGQRLEWIHREKLPRLVDDIANVIIRSAKDRRLSPEELRIKLEEIPIPLPLAQLGLEIYADYQRALEYRGAVDFDDLVLYANIALINDPDLLERLQYRWPFILEDEAQDSSRLQQEVLALLAGEGGNWVRVGDPNQAIYETFTTANPEHLIRFLNRQDVSKRPLPNSGRSTLSIIDLANFLVTWTRQDHPVEEVRKALYAIPLIEPVPEGDPQTNPDDQPMQVHFHKTRLTPQEEIEIIADSISRWLPDHGDFTLAVLAPRNVRGFEMTDELKRRGLPFIDGLLRSSSTTRFSAGALGHILRYLANPDSQGKLAAAYLVWRRAEREDGKPNPQVEQAAELLRKLVRVEEYISPQPGKDWLLKLEETDIKSDIIQSLTNYRELIRRWQHAILLPIDQMLLAVSQDILNTPAELAIAHKLAIMLRQTNKNHPNWRLPELSDELVVIARNQRRFLGFDEEDAGFDPEQHKGKVVVATMHKAKGLEWDRVYLMSVNNYDFPSALPGDAYIGEPWYLRDRLNLAAESLSQLETAFETSEYAWYQEGGATKNARLDYASERLRLLYVGITRAKRELIVTWNSGRDGKIQPAVPFVALESYWSGKKKFVPEEGF